MAKENFHTREQLYVLCARGINGANWIKNKADWKGEWILHIITCRFGGLVDAWR
jgi:hypothetical protein